MMFIQFVRIILIYNISTLFFIPHHKAPRLLFLLDIESFQAEYDSGNVIPVVSLFLLPPFLRGLN